MTCCLSSARFKTITINCPLPKLRCIDFPLSCFSVLARNKIESDLPGVATVDVDLELGEGDDEPNNAFFDMRGEGFYKDEQRVGSNRGQGKG